MTERNAMVEWERAEAREWNTGRNDKRISTEILLGTEDCAYRSGGEWYWQARGSASVNGPFCSLSAASEDYHDDEP